MMSFGSVAYESYVRIRSESDNRTFPDWTELEHERRLAWEAAAQSVAIAALPILMKDETCEWSGELQNVDQMLVDS